MRAQHKKQYERHISSLSFMESQESQSVTSAPEERSRTRMPTEDIREESDFDEYTTNASKAMKHRNLKSAEGTQSRRSSSYGVHIEIDEVSDGADSDIEDPLGLQEVERRNSFCEDCNELVDGGLALHRESTSCPTLPRNERSSSSNNNCVTPRVGQKSHNFACSRHDSWTIGSKSGNDTKGDESENHQVSSIASRYFTPYNGCESEDHENSNAEINDDEGTEVERGVSVGLSMADKTGKEIEFDVDKSSDDMNIDGYCESEVDKNETSQIASDGFPPADQHSKRNEKGHRFLHKYGTPKPSICAASMRITEGLRRLQQESEIDLQSETIGDMELEEE